MPNNYNTFVYPRVRNTGARWDLREIITSNPLSELCRRSDRETTAEERRERFNREVARIWAARYRNVPMPIPAAVKRKRIVIRFKIKMYACKSENSTLCVPKTS